MPESKLTAFHKRSPVLFAVSCFYIPLFTAMTIRTLIVGHGPGADVIGPMLIGSAIPFLAAAVVFRIRTKKPSD